MFPKTFICDITMYTFFHLMPYSLTAQFYNLLKHFTYGSRNLLLCNYTQTETNIDIVKNERQTDRWTEAGADSAGIASGIWQRCWVIKTCCMACWHSETATRCPNRARSELYVCVSVCMWLSGLECLKQTQYISWLKKHWNTTRLVYHQICWEAQGFACM